MTFTKLSHQILVAFVAVVIVTLGISGWGIATLARRIIAENITRQHQMLADRIAQEIELRREDVEPVLSNLASSPPIQSMDSTQVAAELHRYQTRFSTITSIYVADLDGQQIARTDGQQLENVVTMLGFQVAREGRELISDVYFQDGVGTILTVYEPIPDGDRVIGVLVADMNFAWVQKVLENLALIRGETAVILAQNGRVVAHSRMYELAEPPALTDPALIQELVQSPPGVLEGYTDELGRTVVGSHAPVGELGWGVVIQSPLEELAAEVAVLYRSIGLGLLGGTILTVVVGWLMSRNLTRPIQRLMQVARRVEAGDLSAYDPQPYGVGELGQLGRAFGEMLSALQDRDAETEQAHDALHKSESRYRGLFEDSPVSLWEEDFSGAKVHIDALREAGVKDFRVHFANHPESVRICAAAVKVIDVNGATLELLHCKSKSELIGELAQILSEEAYEVFRKELISLTEDKRSFVTEYSDYTWQGDKIHASLGLTVMPGYEDTWSRVLISLTDITERKQAEEALQTSEKRYRALFEQAPVMYLIVRNDLGTPVVFDCNASFLTALGYTRNQVVGQPLASFYTPESQTALLEEGGFQQALRGETEAPMERYLVARDGHIVTTVLRAVPEVDESGQVIGTRAMFTDITEQARLHDQVRRNAAELEKRIALATAEIRQRADELATLYDISQDLVATLDLETLLPTVAQRVADTLKADRCTIFLYEQQTGMLRSLAAHGYMAERLTDFCYESGEEIVGQAYAKAESQYVPDLDLVPDLPRRDTIRAVLAVPLVSPAAGPLGVLSAASLQPGAFTSGQRLLLETLAGQIAGAIGNARLYETAKEADRVKSAFLAAMSHELRTPLNSIIGFTGILLQGLPGPLNGEQTKQLGMVQSSARHLLNLINDVLDISKIEAGQLHIACESFDMREAIERVLQTVTPLAEKKGLTLIAEVAPKVGLIDSDRRRVEQILINLLNNGIKFTEQGEVRVQCQVSDAWLTTRVVDTGIGIKSEDMDILFEPFRQIDTGLARKREGTGLGLSICKRLVGMLGGEIWVNSEWGTGSTFTFTLPLQTSKGVYNGTQDPRH